MARLIEQQSLGLESGSALQPIAVDWWKALNDPQLDALMEEALRDSPSLAQALARVRLAESRSQTDIAANKPRFAIDADETRQRFSENYYIPPPFAGDTVWIGQATANMHWDLDFWGRQAALIRESRSQTVAGMLDVSSARLALAGAVAQAYVDLLSIMGAGRHCDSHAGAARAAAQVDSAARCCRPRYADRAEDRAVLSTAGAGHAPAS